MKISYDCEELIEELKKASEILKILENQNKIL